MSSRQEFERMLEPLLKRTKMDLVVDFAGKSYRLLQREITEPVKDGEKPIVRWRGFGPRLDEPKMRDFIVALNYTVDACSVESNEKSAKRIVKAARDPDVVAAEVMHDEAIEKHNAKVLKKVNKDAKDASSRKTKARA